VTPQQETGSSRTVRRFGVTDQRSSCSGTAKDRHGSLRSTAGMREQAEHRVGELALGEQGTVEQQGQSDPGELGLIEHAPFPAGGDQIREQPGGRVRPVGEEFADVILQS
jgi:hypothetical protein